MKALKKTAVFVFLEYTQKILVAISGATRGMGLRGFNPLVASQEQRAPIAVNRRDCAACELSGYGMKCNGAKISVWNMEGVRMKWNGRF